MSGSIEAAQEPFDTFGPLGTPRRTQAAPRQPAPQYGPQGGHDCARILIAESDAYHRRVLRVLLAHQPRSAAAAADAGFDVQLSGHTHGGQIWPFHWLVPLQQPFTAGVHRLRSLWIYTSRGTGYWGPPLRLFVPSEITRLRLVAMPDAAAGSSPADAAD